ncbi:hypothetical protein ABEB36_005184 [Hypothenemus hampei]|uniref:Corticotropin-releasing factor-binding protein n=1 Tax=Hypothenemus hampei TaxID=57062 RepID=A0ABD1EXR0_HYPHA
MTFIGTFCFHTILYLSVFVLMVSGRPDGWMGFINPSRSSFGVNFEPSTKLDINGEVGNDFLMSPIRPKRDFGHIEECMNMVSEEGEYYHKAKTHPDGRTCGIYIRGETDENIEIRFNYFDVSCDNGGLVAVVDGWELNGELFPSPSDHPKALKSRFNEFCGKKKIKQVFVSSQNVALIQYRMPARGAGFGISIRFVRNPTPCNIMVQLDETYTLRNYERRSNCSITSLFPSAVRILSLNVGITPTRERGIEFETGILHKVRFECHKRGLDDYVQIGGSSGLDNRNMKIADSVCGLSSRPARHVDYVNCGTTIVRLISSGAYDNSITLSFNAITENDIPDYMSVVCEPNDLPLEKK